MERLFPPGMPACGGDWRIEERRANEAPPGASEGMLNYSSAFCLCWYGDGLPGIVYRLTWQQTAVLKMIVRNLFKSKLYNNNHYKYNFEAG